MRNTLISLCTLALVMSAGCDRESKPADPAGSTQDVHTPNGGKDANVAVAPKPQPKPEPPPKPKTAESYSEALLKYLKGRTSGGGRAAEEQRKSLELKVGQLRRFRRTISKAYAAREYKLFISDGATLSDTGRKAALLILDVESHGLEASPYPTEALKTALDTYDRSMAGRSEALGKAGDGSAALARLIALSKGFTWPERELNIDTRRRLAKELLKVGLTDDQAIGKQIQELRRFHDGLSNAALPARQALLTLDPLIVAGFLQYALDFRYLVVAHPFNAVTVTGRAKAPVLWQTRLLQELVASQANLADAMTAMWPKHPYYQKARDAYGRYRKMAADKSFPDYTVRRVLKKGRKSKDVLLLKARLHAEGYYDGDRTDPTFGADLEDAVKDYQHRHQLKEDGIVRDRGGIDGVTRKSLGVDMTRRSQQLKLSLQRWRESPTHREPFYFRVNVPQFEVEVWDGDKLARKHRIIVGNNKFEVDANHGRKGHLNRTALISDHISKVVINPLWHVPERIRLDEIIPEMEKDPEYLEKHGYKVRVVGTREMVYQEAGPGNALGRVKLLFPNKHSIYMHDTPKRRLFKRTTRAFSHGCMRLEDPVDMATFLLERQGLMTAQEVERVLATKKERGVNLKEKVPIHIEYNTVAFEPGSDLPIFLNDVYRYDKAFYEGDVPILAEEKIPVVKAEPRSMLEPIEPDEPDPRADDDDEGETADDEEPAPAPKKVKTPPVAPEKKVAPAPAPAPVKKVAPAPAPSPI